VKIPRFQIRLTDRLAYYQRLHVGRCVMVEAASDRAVRRFLVELEDYLSSAGPTGGPRWLLPFRDDFRRIVAHEPTVGLVQCLRQEGGEQRRLAIWLLGRIGGQRAISIVAVYRWDPDVRVRRHVARALLRMEGWQYLRDVAREEVDPVARRFAVLAELPPRPFSERVGRFLCRDVRSPAPPRNKDSGSCPFYLGARVGGGLPPRSPEFIRAILERIRRLVASSRRLPWP